MSEEREFILCSICKRKIYYAGNGYDGDDYYDMEDGDICEDCIWDYMKNKRRTLQ